MEKLSQHQFNDFINWVDSQFKSTECVQMMTVVVVLYYYLLSKPSLSACLNLDSLLRLHTPSHGLWPHGQLSP